MKSQADYLNIPLMFNLYVTPNLAFKAGAQLGLNLSGKSKYTETPYTVKENGDVIYEKPEDVEVDMKCKNVAFSIPCWACHTSMRMWWWMPLQHRADSDFQLGRCKKSQESGD